MPVTGQPEAQGAPATPGAAAAQQMLARLQQCRTLRARFSGQLTWDGQRFESALQLSFQRGAAGGAGSESRLRLDVKNAGQDLTAVLQGRRATVWLPGHRMVLRQELPDTQERLWDSFANPLQSFLAMLSPTADDRRALEQTFLPRVRLLPAERVEGETLVHLRRRGALGVVVDFWLDPKDHSLRRVGLSQPNAPAEMQAEYQIVVQSLDQPLPGALFQLQIPKNAIDPMKEAEREVAREPQERTPDLQARLRRLEARAAKAPRDAALQMQLAAACQESNLVGKGIAALRRGVAIDPSLPNYGRAWQLAGEMAQWRAAVRFLLAGLERFGERVLDVGSDDDMGVLALAQAAGMTAEVARGLEKTLPSAKNPWRVRAQLVALQAAAGDAAAAARHWLALVDAGDQQRAFEPARVDAIREATAVLAEAPVRWPDPLIPSMLAALRGGERTLPDDTFTSLTTLYLRLNSPSDAARLVELVRPEEIEIETLRDVAAALKRSGDQHRAERLFRLGLLLAAEQEPVDYASIVQLLAVPEGKQVLSPVLAELARAESTSEPLAAAHWLHLAGDARAAAAAYERFLSSPQGAPDTASAAERYLAASLGAVSSRQAGDIAGAQRLLRLAIDEMPFAEVETGYSQEPLADLLLEAAQGTPAFGEVFKSLAAASPPAAFSWLSRQGSAPEELDGPSLRKALDHVLPWLRHQEQPATAVAGLLANFGRPEEALDPLVAALKEKPEEIDGNVILTVAERLKDPGPLFIALREAMKKHPNWHDGIALLARCRAVRGDGAAAMQELVAAAGRLRSADLYQQLSELRCRAGQVPEAIAALQEALKLEQDNPELVAALARMLVESGARPRALGLYRRLAAAAPAQLWAETARGLKDCGQPAEAARYLERVLKTLARSDADLAGALRSELAGLYLLLRQPQKALTLYKATVAEVCSPDFEPESPASRRGGRRMVADASAMPLVARALEQTGNEAGARRAYAAAVIEQSGAGADCPAYLRLAIKARAFDEARSLFARLSPDGPRFPGLLREVCLAALDEAGGEAARAPERAPASVFRRAAHPGGSPFPHLSPEAQIACERLAAQAEKDGRAEDAARYRRWSDAMQRAWDGDFEKAAALFPESPCLTFLRARLAPDPAGFSTPDSGASVVPAHAPDAALARRALDQLLPVAGEADGCPVCEQGLRSLAAAGPLLQEWLSAHAGNALAHLVIGMSRADPDSAPGVSRRAEDSFRKAVSLDPQLAAAWVELRTIYEMLPGHAGPQLETARKVVALRPEDPDALAGLARACLRSGRRGEADEALQRLRRFDPQAEGLIELEARREYGRMQETEPLLQILAGFQQRGQLAARWLVPELYGLPLAGWAGAPAALLE